MFRKLFENKRTMKHVENIVKKEFKKYNIKEPKITTDYGDTIVQKFISGPKFDSKLYDLYYNGNLDALHTAWVDGKEYEIDIGPEYNNKEQFIGIEIQYLQVQFHHGTPQVTDQP